MIVCHSRRFIFVHLHKTGGTSVKEALQPFLSDGDFAMGQVTQGRPTVQTVDDMPRPLRKHSNTRRIAEVVGTEIWNSYFKFSFVRHPLDRLVSLYEFFCRVRHNNTPRSGMLNRMLGLGQSNRLVEGASQTPWSWPGMQALMTTRDFSGFIRSEFLSKDQGAQPQVRSLTDRSGALMVDFVGKFENFSEDWKRVGVRLGIQSSLPHANRSERRYEDVRKYWNEENLRFASEKYRKDFEMFGYSPDGI